MLPSAKIAPSCSLQTAASIRGELRVPSAWQQRDVGSVSASAAKTAPTTSYVGLPPSPSRHAHREPPPRRRKHWRRLHPAVLLAWLRAWPQTAFLLLVVACTYASGLSAVTQLAHALLTLARVPHAAADAQQRYTHTSIALHRVSSCVADLALAHTATLQAALQTHKQRVRETVGANAVALDELDDRVTACSRLLFRTINASTDAQPALTSTAQCFTAAMLANDTDASFGARELVDRVRITLLAHTPMATALPTALQSADDPTTAAAQELQRSVTAVFAAAQMALTAADQSDLVDDAAGSASATRDALLQDVDSTSPTHALVLTQSAMDALGALRTTLQQSLRPLSPTQRAVVTKFLNATAVGEWRELERRVRVLQNQSVELQRELQHAVHSASARLRSSAKSMRAVLERAEADVVALHAHWITATQAAYAAQDHAWRAADVQLRALARALAGTRPHTRTSRHYRDLELDTTDPAAELAQQQVLLVQHRHELQPERLSGSSSSDAAVPPLLGVTPTHMEVRAALAIGAGLWRTGEAIVYALDWGRVGFSILEVAVALWTDSYSAIAPVDIRGVSSIQTLRDVWTLLQCRHDASSVCYFVVTQADVLLQLAAAYFVWIAVGVAGTGALVMWRQDFASVCFGSGGDAARESHTLVQTLLASVLPIRATVWDPEREFAAQSAATEQLAQQALWRIANASERAWSNQTATLTQLETYGSTLATLTRLFDTCASEHTSDGSSSGEPSSISISDACASLDVRSRRALLTPPPSPPTELLDIFAASARNESLQHCARASVSLVSQSTSDPSICELHRDQACAAEHALYLTVASWWLLCVVWSAMRCLARMAVAASALTAWRSLSASRLELVGFCLEDGSVVARETLPRAVRDRLRDVRWFLALRGLGATLTVAVSAAIWFLVLHRVL